MEGHKYPFGRSVSMPIFNQATDSGDSAGANGFATNLEDGQNAPRTAACLAENTTPHKDWLPGLEHRSSDTDKTSPPKELYIPGGFGYHRRRMASQLSLAQVINLHETTNANADLSSQMSPDSLLYFSPQQSRKHRAGPKKSPEKLDLHVLKVSANAVGSPYHRSKSFGFGHERTITDPFVDNAGMNNKSPVPAPFSLKPSLDTRSHIPIPDTPTIKFSGRSVAQSGRETDSSPAYQGFDSPNARRDCSIPNAPVFQPIPPTTQGHFSQLPTVSKPAHRADLPIPPPVLSSVQDQLHHSPETRDRLDARAAMRAEWIRTEAAKIAELRLKSFAAEHQYRATNAQEDFIEWQRLAGEYASATDLDKRQEERRNMFMPAGMQAMRTGVENVEGDESASYGSVKGQTQGKLLGFNMAFMERVTTEVERRKEEHEGEEITKEMLATLKPDEKKVLRQFLVDRLGNEAEHRG